MRPSYLKICQLLASSGFSDREILDFIHDLLNLGPNTVMADIQDIRRIMANSLSKQVFDLPASYYHMPPSDTALKIERLLIEDAGLTKMIAINWLSEELRRKYPGLQIPSESRKGFHTWIHRLSSIIPEKELLHIASKLRNRSVNELPSDWRLKE